MVGDTLKARRQWIADNPGQGIATMSLTKQPKQLRKDESRARTRADRVIANRKCPACDVVILGNARSRYCSKRCKSISRTRNKERVSKQARLGNLRKRITSIDTLGGECVVCGNRDLRVLQIDHVIPTKLSHDRTAGARRREHERRAIARGEVDLGTLQVLCANCHCIKTHADNGALIASMTVEEVEALRIQLAVAR